MEFLSSLSLETRSNLSLSGVDPQTIYHSFKEDWNTTTPVMLFRDNQVLAIGKLRPYEDGVYLSCLVVRDDYQNQHLGTRLVKYMFALSLLNGFNTMYTEVKKDNLRALAFFKSLHFKRIVEKEMTYLMKRNLQ